MTSSMNLKDRLGQSAILPALGVYDALTALIAEQCGFAAAFVSGSAISHSQLARPDIGLVTLTEMALAIERIRDRVDMHLLVDADSGFGNAFDVGRTVRTFERAGANGIQIEDQFNTKRPKEVTTRPVIPTARMVGKIKAALDARRQDDTVISARTDAVFTLGVDRALDRTAAFMDAGADMVFVEGLKDRADIERLAELCDGRAPILYNLLDPDTFSIEQMQQMGLSMAVYPTILIHSMANSGRMAAADLARSLGVSDAQVEINPLNTIIESADFLEHGCSFDAE